jgi:hypothetical protein
VINFRQLKTNTKEGLGGSFDMTEELSGVTNAADKTDDLEEKIY